jgi:N-acetylneuraminic acid mutarotase
MRSWNSAGFSRKMLLPGCLSVLTLLVLTVYFMPSAQAGTWGPTGSLATAQNGQSVLLPSGKVLIVGGYGNEQILSSCHLYDPNTGTWSDTDSMQEARDEFSLVLLANGRVLAIGGMGTAGTLNTCELYDPKTELWTPAASLTDARAFAGATRLADGKVLVVGGSYDAGNNNSISLSSAELYDPDLKSWSKTKSSLKTARHAPAVSLLKNGKVLVAGGNGGSPSWLFLSSCELYDPETGLFSDTGSFKDARAYAAGVVLANGKVLLVGGWGNSTPGNTALSSCQDYDPGTGTWGDTGSLKTARQEQPVVLLASGKVLTFGGWGAGDIILRSSELYNPATGRWHNTGFLKTARNTSAAVLLPNGKVLAAGGHGASGEHLTSAELYTPGEAGPAINMLLLQ